MSTIFGNRIKTIREEKQIPQRQLASALEIDTATYSFFQNYLKLTQKS